MKRIAMFAAAALLVGVPAGQSFAGDSSTAIAQNDNKLTIEPADKTPATDTQVEPGVQSGDTDAGTTSDVDIGKIQAAGVAPSADDVLSAMKGNAASVSTIKSMTAVSKVHAVRIGDLPEADNTPSLESAIEANGSQIDSLREAIRTNTSLTTILDKQNVDVSAIIATRTGDDGSLTVYTK